MELTRAQADKMVAKAFVFLDTHAPVGWKDRVNVEGLDMQSGTRCIGGQLCGDWWSFTTAMNERVPGVDLIELGFDTFGGFYDYETLTEAWRDALTA